MIYVLGLVQMKKI